MAPIVVNTDCSGMEAPIQALRALDVPVKHRFSCDVCPAVRKTIAANFPPEEMYTDITVRDNKKAAGCDIYVAGFPCQPFSSAGLQKGFTDRRGKIFFNVLDYIKSKRPRTFILENVSGLVKLKQGKYFKSILAELNALRNPGYNISHQIVDTKDHGVPHSRRRIYVVGIRKDVDRGTFEFPAKIKCPSIELFLDAKKKTDNPAALPPNSQGTAKKNVLYWNRKLIRQGVNPAKDTYIIDVDSSAGRSKAVKGISPCMTCSRSAGHWISTRGRRLNKDEMLRMQGMKPSEFKCVVSLNQLGRQLGNAMSVNVLERIFCNLLPAAGLTKASKLEDRWASGAAVKALRGTATYESPCKRSAEEADVEAPCKRRRTAQ